MNAKLTQMSNTQKRILEGTVLIAITIAALIIGGIEHFYDLVFACGFVFYAIKLMLIKD